MKKTLVSICFVFGFIINAFYQRSVSADVGSLQKHTISLIDDTLVPENTNNTNTNDATGVAQTVTPTNITVRHSNEDDNEGENEDGNSVVQAPIAVTATKPVSVKAPTPVPVPVPTKVTTPTPVPTPVVPQGKYRNGTYTGTQVDASYGIVQVQAVITNGKISDVIFLSYPNDRSQSIRKSMNAMPILKQEAIAVQDANVNAVSGASYTSAAFVESMTSALSQAL